MMVLAGSGLAVPRRRCGKQGRHERNWKRNGPRHHRIHSQRNRFSPVALLAADAKRMAGSQKSNLHEYREQCIDDLYSAAFSLGRYGLCELAQFSQSVFQAGDVIIQVTGNSKDGTQYTYQNVMSDNIPDLVAGSLPAIHRTLTEGGA